MFWRRDPGALVTDVRWISSRLTESLTQLMGTSYSQYEHNNSLSDSIRIHTLRPFCFCDRVTPDEPRHEQAVPPLQSKNNPQIRIHSPAHILPGSCEFANSKVVCQDITVKNSGSLLLLFTHYLLHFWCVHPVWYSEWWERPPKGTFKAGYKLFCPLRSEDMLCKRGLSKRL